MFAARTLPSRVLGRFSKFVSDLLEVRLMRFVLECRKESDPPALPPHAVDYGGCLRGGDLQRADGLRALGGLVDLLDLAHGVLVHEAGVGGEVGRRGTGNGDDALVLVGGHFCYV